MGILQENPLSSPCVWREIVYCTRCPLYAVTVQVTVFFFIVSFYGPWKTHTVVTATAIEAWADCPLLARL